MLDGELPDDADGSAVVLGVTPDVLDGVLPDDADGSNVLLGVTEEDALGDAVME